AGGEGRWAFSAQRPYNARSSAPTRVRQADLAAVGTDNKLTRVVLLMIASCGLLRHDRLLRAPRKVLLLWLLLPAFAAAQLPGNVPTLAPMIERVSPAVVNISVSGVVRIDSPLADDPLFRRFFPDSNRPVQSAGSGVIVD